MSLIVYKPAKILIVKIDHSQKFPTIQYYNWHNTEEAWVSHCPMHMHVFTV